MNAHSKPLTHWWTPPIQLIGGPMWIGSEVIIKNDDGTETVILITKWGGPRPSQDELDRANWLSHKVASLLSTSTEE